MANANVRFLVIEGLSSRVIKTRDGKSSRKFTIKVLVEGETGLTSVSGWSEAHVKRMTPGNCYSLNQSERNQYGINITKSTKILSTTFNSVESTRMASVADAMRNPPLKTTVEMATMPLYSRVSVVGIITSIVKEINSSSCNLKEVEMAVGDSNLTVQFWDQRLITLVPRTGFTIRFTALEIRTHMPLQLAGTMSTNITVVNRPEITTVSGLPKSVSFTDELIEINNILYGCSSLLLGRLFPAGFGQMHVEAQVEGTTIISIMEDEGPAEEIDA